MAVAQLTARPIHPEYCRLSKPTGVGARMDLDLKGKAAIVTGGSRGIGKAIALALAKEGANVAIVARDRGALDAARAEIAGATGVKVEAYSSDTGDDAAVRKMVAEAVAALGRIDILVNCAAQPGGQGKPPTLGEITNEHFWADMNIKVMGYLRTSREVAPHMIKAGSGRIIHVSGLAARSTGTMIGSMRNVSVAALTKNMADELGPHGISVVCVHRASRGPKNTGRDRRSGQSPERLRKGNRNPHGRPQSRSKDHHGRGGRRRRDLPCLAQGRRHQRRCDRCRRRCAGRDPLLS